MNSNGMGSATCFNKLKIFYHKYAFPKVQHCGTIIFVGRGRKMFLNKVLIAVEVQRYYV